MADDVQQEIRQDLITKQWVICAPTRNSRPKPIHESDDAPAPGDATPVDGCPFCPGHEEMLPHVIWELSASNGLLNGAASSAEWATRVVPNKYPALTTEPEPRKADCGLYRLRAGLGRQEVVVDTPFHHQTLAKMDAAHVDAVLNTYLQRYHALREDGFRPFIFRNHGADAGASLAHPHSQIIATHIEPPHVQFEETQAKTHYADTGRCAYCEMLQEEIDAQARVVVETDAFVAFVPYAARAPYETWILPRDHDAEFGRLQDADRRDLADVLQTILRRMYVHLGDPDYNLFVRTALDYGSESDALHWSVRIRPRMTVDAGFEISTGMNIVPSLPERDAELLRTAP